MRKTIHHRCSCTALFTSKLCVAKYVDNSSLLNLVVKMMNLKRTHELNHRQFRDALKDTNTESHDLPNYTTVRWLSCENVMYLNEERK
ncbi:hypothetical protein NPIL_504391 [Nephila pilipes]|uniref:Uncharacterized protein n=1 Tax=Nephila pilipes TaxID=299642 RepID=A0A8X6NWA2_NEPPI|nr:hypothetical protein NPIL_504391 [Nephila pilipes]